MNPEEIRCQFVILEEIRYQFVILARKDEPIPDYPSRKDEPTPDYLRCLFRVISASAGFNSSISASMAG